MAPEIFQNLNACNKACDVYSFAISIWEIVTRRFPYEDNPEITDDLSLRAEVLTGTRPSLMVYFDPYSSELLNSSWNSDPTSRTSMETIVAFFDERNPTEPSEQLSNKQISIKLNEETPKDSQEDLTDGFHLHRKVTGMDGSEYILFLEVVLAIFGAATNSILAVAPSCVQSNTIYTYTKAAYFNDYETSESIMRATSPHEMKKLGRMITNFDLQKWSKPSLKAMLIANVHKYMQNLNLQKALESTAPLEMVEALPHDKMWGIGRSIDTPQALDRSQWRGKNFLGKMLDAIRSALISKEFETPDQMIDHLCPVFDCEHVNFFSDS